MKSQEHIDDLIKVILTAEEKESVSNQMVGEVLEFLNERELHEFIGFTYIEAVIIPASGGEVLVGVRTRNDKWTVE